MAFGKRGLFGYLKTLLPLQLIIFYLFIASGLLVNFLQLLSLIIWPFNKQLYRRVNRFLAAGFWSDLTFLAQYWSGSTCDIYMNEEDFKYINKEHAICIMNHKYDIDWLMGWMVCQRTGLLPGSKIIGKSSLRMIPLIGWCWLFTESIFIKRKWDTDHKILIESMDSKLAEYPKDCYYNILMFCEGTRFTKRKHEESMRVAKEKGLPELKHHLLPRTKGFSLLARGAADRLGIEGTDGAKPDLNSIRNGVPLKGEIFVRRIPMSQVPKDEQKSAEFLHKFYKEKDDIYDVYARTGSFESLGAKKIELPLNYYDLCIVLFWAVLLCTPMFYYIYTFVINGTLISNALLFLFLFITSFGADLFIRVTQTEKTSSKYGLNDKKE